jgi:hypothetical protein
VAAEHGSSKGVTVSIAARQATIRFTKAANALYRRYQERRLWLQCVYVELRSDGTFGGSNSVTAPFTVRQRLIRVRLQRPPTGFSYCRIARSARFYDLRGEVVAVALSNRGRAYLNERDSAVLLFRLSDAAYSFDANGWRFVSAAEFGRRLAGKYVVEALAGPQASPAPGKIGYWSDGKRHAVFTKLTSRHRRFFLELTDDVLSTNMVAYLRYIYS